MESDFRLNTLLFFILLVGVLILGRLLWWQVISSEKLTAAGEEQRWISFEISADRGKILAHDGFNLVSNESAFLVFASIPDLKQAPGKIASRISSILFPNEDLLKSEEMIKQRLRRQDLVWVPLKRKVDLKTKKVLEDLKIEGMGFEEEEKRNYPEGSTAAHILGFVGSDVSGTDKGYFGLEGHYDLELRGRSGVMRREKDASGKPILVGEIKEEKPKNGRSLLTTIDRSVQFITEEKLKRGIQRYGASSGSVVVMEPKTGAILAMSSYPSYDPATYYEFDKNLFSNPVVASSFEPGSIFKILIMAAALNEDVVKPDTICDKCSGPVNIADYTIKTWNDKYFPNSTMIEVIQHSDNVGMVFVAQKLGISKMVSYIEGFDLGKPSGIDLQDESSPLLRKKNEWKQIDIATASFGQGIAVTPIQMIKAANAIANQGKIMKPFIVKKVIGEEGETEIIPKVERQIIKPVTAYLMTQMMVNAVDNGEAKWTKPKGFRIAGKTGTAQIPLRGHYDEGKTIASFVGFAPADDPKFIMLVILREPTSSPWGSETAAPLWFDICKELFTYYGVLPEQ